MVTKTEVYRAYRLASGRPLTPQHHYHYNYYFSRLIIELFIAAYEDDPMLPEILAKIKRKDPWLYHKVIERLGMKQ